MQAHRQDTLYFWLMVMSSFIFALVLVFLVYMMVKFRAKPGDDSDGAPIHGHTGLEIVWTVIPIVIVLGFAIYGAAALGRNEALAEDRLIVDVQGQQFAWTFTYPSYGKLKTGILALPVGRQVEFRITAVEHDVLHSFYIPAFRLKQDAVPGVPQKMIATPDRLGTYMVTCAELCGIGHSQMRTVLHVMSPAEFTAWIAEQKKAAAQPAAGGNTDPAAIFSSNVRELPHVQARQCERHGRARPRQPDGRRRQVRRRPIAGGLCPGVDRRPGEGRRLGLPGRRHAHELRDEPDVGSDRRVGQVSVGRRELNWLHMSNT